MDKAQNELAWDAGVEEAFQSLIARTPVFLQGVARQKVSARIRRLLREQDRARVDEGLLVDAFFAETPFGFHGLLKKDLKELNIDYGQYGHKE